jgi:hypothetical protein
MYSFSPNTRAESQKINDNFSGLADGTEIDTPNFVNNAGIWWAQIAENTLTVAGDTLTVTSVPARDFLMIYVYTESTGGATNTTLTFNADTGNNYAYSAADLASGGAISTTTSAAGIAFEIGTGVSGATPVYICEIFNNSATREKQCFIRAQYSATGAATGPTVSLIYGKWANTTEQIDEITITNVGAGDFAIGSRIVVLGHD